MTLRCSDCEETVLTCACPVSVDRFADEAFHDLTITAREASVMEIVAACVKSGATTLALGPGEAWGSLEHHAMCARLAGDLDEAARIKAIRCVGRVVAADRRAA